MINDKWWQESICTKNSHTADIETDRLIKHGKTIEINEILKQNERKSLSLSLSIKSIEMIR